MSERSALIDQFLTSAGWGKAAREPVPGDASVRRYSRLTRGAQRAVLMDVPKFGQPSAYAQQANLASNDPAAFTAIAQSLSARGFSAPKILAADLKAGLLLLEDFGRVLYAPVIANDPQMEAPLYLAAAECLAAIYRSSFDTRVTTYGQSWDIRDYNEAALLAEADLMLEWYIPHRGGAVTPAMSAKWHGLWRKAFGALSQHTSGLVLRDFHAENIFWLPDRQDTGRVGLIDFQDAVFGHPAYDLVSLIEDARRDVSPDLAAPMIARFCESAKIKNDDAFAAAYAVIAAQRNAKILGIFVRLAKRDGKAAYLDLLPRVEQHFMSDLAHPALADLAAWLKRVLK